ncbi:oxidoreductase [Talaromyces proteolyticus]|uniref:Oxidoreductase n=1 Tax=Talaromyces proteolyticus TaxID=1131652 RepID=A0AAD4PTN3_9EURO|nr:oxidoreductase [Talaromyces proteolyticus]KAH8693713.1 oxidoreductase [Talaromyces proteolyticus]
MSRNILIVGATRGLGASLATLYASLPSTSTVYTTTRSSKPPASPSHPKFRWLLNIDISQPDIGSTLTTQLHPYNSRLHTVIISAGYFGFETFDELDWQKQVSMYTTSAVGPVFAVQALAKGSLLATDEDCKIILISSESGSIALRHEKEGGGNYGHHASKAALNMVGKLLALDLKDKNVAVGLVHPGFMRTEMTRSVGFDKYWDQGGAITPDESAKSLVEFVEKEFDISKTGTYWAPRGAGDIGTAEPVLGKNLPTPLQLPW